MENEACSVEWPKLWTNAGQERLGKKIFIGKVVFWEKARHVQRLFNFAPTSEEY